jgi:hypothetical protein
MLPAGFDVETNRTKCDFRAAWESATLAGLQRWSTHQLNTNAVLGIRAR